MAMRVAVLGGGRSSEHEVSLASAASVAAGLREAGHTVLAVTISREGVWRLHDGDGDGVDPARISPSFPAAGSPEPTSSSRSCTARSARTAPSRDCSSASTSRTSAPASPRVRSAWTRSLFKDLMARAGLPQVRYRGVTAADFAADRDAVERDVAGLGLPVFVKPARLGSSVGIVRVTEPGGLRAALAEALEHDPIAIVEAASPGLEIECSVLGNDNPIASQPGEILLAAGEQGWYDYEAKYTPGGMQLIVRRGSRCGAGARTGARRRGLPALGLLRARPRRFLRRGRPGPRQRAQHDPRVHADERLRRAVRRQWDPLPGAARPPRRARGRASRGARPYRF